MLSWTSNNFLKKDWDFVVSRRAFLKIGALVSMALAGASTGLLALPIRKAEAKGKVDLEKLLMEMLGDEVKGVEQEHQIPQRLAFNLARMGGQPAQLVKVRRRVLLKALKKMKKSNTDNETVTVTHNLNLLLQAIARQRGYKDVKNHLIKAVIATVLFSTGGVHFPETSNLHRQSVNARHALKNPYSGVPISVLKADKAYWLSQYRQAISERISEVFHSLRFPEEVIINRVWKMPA